MDIKTRKISRESASVNSNTIGGSKSKPMLDQSLHAWPNIQPLWWASRGGGLSGGSVLLVWWPLCFHSSGLVRSSTWTSAKESSTGTDKKEKHTLLNCCWFTFSFYQSYSKMKTTIIRPQGWKHICQHLSCDSPLTSCYFLFLSYAAVLHAPPTQFSSISFKESRYFTETQSLKPSSTWQSRRGKKRL